MLICGGKHSLWFLTSLVEWLYCVTCKVQIPLFISLSEKGEKFTDCCWMVQRPSHSQPQLWIIQSWKENQLFKSLDLDLQCCPCSLPWWNLSAMGDCRAQSKATPSLTSLLHPYCEGTAFSSIHPATLSGSFYPHLRDFLLFWSGKCLLFFLFAKAHDIFVCSSFSLKFNLVMMSLQKNHATRILTVFYENSSSKYVFQESLWNQCMMKYWHEWDVDWFISIIMYSVKDHVCKIRVFICTDCFKIFERILLWSVDVKVTLCLVSWRRQTFATLNEESAVWTGLWSSSWRWSLEGICASRKHNETHVGVFLHWSFLIAWTKAHLFDD